MPPRLRRPRKLGQHFLADSRYRERIAAALPLEVGELVIEIGPGEGAMTRLLVERCRKVVAIEVDPSLAERLQEQFQGDPRLVTVRADILSTDLARICREHGASRCFVFGNLPYYITSPILHHLFAAHRSIRAMTLLMQLEVADRLTAQPGSRDYGYLTVLTQIYSEPCRLFTVPPGAFSPPPKVQSALVDFRLSPRLPGWSDEEIDRFLDFARRSFAQKRKTLLNNLESQFPRKRVEAALFRLGLPPVARAEELSVGQLADLLYALSKPR